MLFRLLVNMYMSMVVVWFGLLQRVLCIIGLVDVWVSW